MSDTGIAALAIVIALVPVVIYMTIRYVANVLDEARRDASEAWKEVLAEREARSRAEAEAIQLRARLAPDPHTRVTAQGEIEDARATAPVSKDTLRAILRANHIEPAKDFASDDDPTHP